MGTLNYHKKLKTWAKNILQDMGFSETEIFEEYEIKVGNYTKYFVDVVGISDNKKIFL